MLHLSWILASKAYDKLDLDHFRDIMTQMGFSSRWVS